MRCKDVESLIISADERVLDSREQQSLKQHLKSCTRCADFMKFWNELQQPIGNMPIPPLPAELEESVRLLCIEKINRLEQSPDFGRFEQLSYAPIPWSIWAALTVLVIVTFGLITPEIESFWQNQKITGWTVVAFVLILQNAIMLFFAPVILRLYRSRSASFHRMKHSGGFV